MNNLRSFVFWYSSRCQSLPESVFTSFHTLMDIWFRLYPTMKNTGQSNVQFTSVYEMQTVDSAAQEVQDRVEEQVRQFLVTGPAVQWNTMEQCDDSLNLSVHVLIRVLAYPTIRAHRFP